NFLDSDHTQNHFNGFLQDTMSIGDKLILVASLRLDKHPLLTKLQVSPRGAVVYQPAEGHALRVSSGRAFRTPTFLESYLDLMVHTPLRAVGEQPFGAELRERFGVPPLRPEEIISTEIGYRFAGSRYFDVDVAAYYNFVRDLVILDNIYPYTMND